MGKCDSKCSEQKKHATMPPRLCIGMKHIKGIGRQEMRQVFVSALLERATDDE